MADTPDEIAAWRRELHANPELGYELPRTAGFVAEKLRSFGCDDVVQGIGRSGVVGVIHGRSRHSGRVVGLRADMDALPLEETTNLAHASKIAGRMHACGHDGHTAMLLGAAKRLAQTRNFDGTAVLIFQPAEEGHAGAKAMCDDGLMTRWNIERVFALHNEPGLPIGHFATRPGPFGCAVAVFYIAVEGKVAHSGSPQAGVDALLPAANIVISLNTIIGRNVPPLKSGTVTLNLLQGGRLGSTFATSAEMKGLIRWFEPDVRDALRKRIVDISTNVSSSYGDTAVVQFRDL